MNTPEHQPGTQSADASDVFLSPRLVDENAFNRFAAALRLLIDQAGSQRESLTSTTAKAEMTAGQIREATQEQQANLDLAARAIKTIAQREQAIKDQLEAFEARAKDIEALEAKAEKTIASKEKALQFKLEAIGVAGEQRLAQLETRMHDLEAKAQQALGEVDDRIAQKVTPALDRLESLVVEARRAADPESVDGLAGLIQRAGQAGEQAAFALKQLDDLRAQAETTRAQMGQSVNDWADVIDRVSDQQDALRASIDESVQVSQDARERLDGRIAALRGVIEGAMDDLEPKASGLADELRSAVETATATRRVIAQAVMAGETTAGRLDEALTKLEPWEGLLGGDGNDELPGPLRELVGRVREELRGDLTGVAEVLRGLAGRTERAAAAMDGAVEQAQPPGTRALEPRAERPAKSPAEAGEQPTSRPRVVITRRAGMPTPKRP